MSDDILREQLAYYRARAQEYDESVQQTGRFATPEPQDQQIDAEWAQIVRALHALPPCDDVLELACGTGIWTQELLQVGKTITALDGAPEMLELNRAKIASPRVQYETADLFAWQPVREYDLVFFAFWLSHVPPEQLGSFLDKVAHATRPGGRVLIVDEPAGGNQLSGTAEADNQTRTLHDGRSFQIVKVYYDPAEIQEQLHQRGFGNFEAIVGEYFFYLSGIRNSGS
jgi:ubiquinone/menaquinone biosynthesis C-methylase UbiE